MNDLHTYLEHTYLQPDITYAQVETLVQEAHEHAFAGLCLPPYWIKKARRDLPNDSLVQLVTVIGFPLGYQRTEAKLTEIELALKDGADEFDLVMNYSAFRANPHWVKVEFARCAKFVHEREKMLKVILETSRLSERETLHAATLAQDAGVDFVKTSTGFTERGAELEAVRQLRSTLADYVGIKAAGGIRTAAQARAFIEAGADRIGTSRAVAMVREE